MHGCITKARVSMGASGEPSLRQFDSMRSTCLRLRFNADHLVLDRRSAVRRRERALLLHA